MLDVEMKRKKWELDDERKVIGSIKREASNYALVIAYPRRDFQQLEAF